MQKRCEELRSNLLKLRLGCISKDSNERLSVVLLAAEDHRFFFHRGIDPVAMVRAVVMSILGKAQGGSTIEQQLVRTLIQDYRRTIGRKVTELLLASTVVDSLSKDDVIATYLSIAHFGTHITGMDMAALYLNLRNEVNQTDEAYCILMAHLKYPASAADIDRFAQQRATRIRHISRRVTTRVGWMRLRSQA